MLGRRVSAALAALALVMVGCSGNDSTSSTNPSTTSSPPSSTRPAKPPASPADAETMQRVGAALDAAPGCDVLDTTRCLLPFPSDVFTTADSAAATGRTVALPTGQLLNTKGVPFDPTEWNRNDGFSPGTPMITLLPGVDLTKSKATTIDDIGRSMTAASTTVVLDLDTGKRLPHWAEVDAAPSDTPVPADQRVTLIHPATNLPEGHHIAVAFGPLVDGEGKPIVASDAFTLYRDNRSTTDERIEGRRPEMEKMFDALAAAGVDRATLTVAWDFTVASSDNIAGRLLAIRDAAFKELGSAAPTFAVTETITDSAKLRAGVARLVRGTFEVPNFLTGDGSPGSRMMYDAAGAPTRGAGVITQPFSCLVPQAAVDGPGGTARPVVYGHGLLGSHDEVEGGQASKLAATNDMLYCATDWIGFAEGDLGEAASTLADISRFPAVADRSQQGILGQLFLARLMRLPEGLSSSPAFRTASGASVIDTSEVYYDGNSQGAIMGGAATAVSTEWTKAVLGVPGMNYSILLSRSTDFASYFVILRAAYPDRIDQQIIYGVLQMLWDRFETSGYAAHMTGDPYPGTPKHTVQLHAAFGDHQVANITAEIEARTIGAAIRTPELADGRNPIANPYWGLEAPKGYPYAGSILEYWDSGTLAPPSSNITPTESDAFQKECGKLSKEERGKSAPCNDPHEDPRRQPLTIQQKDAFFRPDGKVVDVCGSDPCAATPAFELDY